MSERLKKDESYYKSDFVKRLKEGLRGAVILRHEDVRTAGIPDLSITFNGKTTWWEAKHATPGFDSTGIQELTMLRLAAHGYARYIIWHESTRLPQRTLIVHPKNLADYLSVQEASFDGFKTDDVVEYIRLIHLAVIR